MARIESIVQIDLYLRCGPDATALLRPIRARNKGRVRMLLFVFVTYLYTSCTISYVFTFQFKTPSCVLSVLRCKHLLWTWLEILKTKFS